MKIPSFDTVNTVSMVYHVSTHQHRTTVSMPCWCLQVAAIPTAPPMPRLINNAISSNDFNTNNAMFTITSNPNNITLISNTANTMSTRTPSAPGLQELAAPTSALTPNQDWLAFSNSNLNSDGTILSNHVTNHPTNFTNSVITCCHASTCIVAWQRQRVSGSYLINFVNYAW